jgi:hypothetical protein
MIVLPSVQAGITGYSGVDLDYANYISKIETADAASLETTTKNAIKAFILGCKFDGIWSSIISCAIFAGARTLNGALSTLKGPALTNNSFVTSNYNRQSGLLGASGKYLNTNLTNTIDAANKNTVHAATYTTTATHTGYTLGSDTTANGTIALRPYAGTASIFRAHNAGSIDNSGASTFPVPIVGFAGVSRSTSTDINLYYKTSTGYFSGTNTVSSVTVVPTNIYVFDRFNSGTLQYNNRIAFYSIGTYLDLAKLEARVKTLIDTYVSLGLA